MRLRAGAVWGDRKTRVALGERGKFEGQASRTGGIEAWSIFGAWRSEEICYFLRCGTLGEMQGWAMEPVCTS